MEQVSLIVQVLGRFVSGACTIWTLIGVKCAKEELLADQANELADFVDVLMGAHEEAA
jgi:hypothetical protein